MSQSIVAHPSSSGDTKPAAPIGAHLRPVLRRWLDRVRARRPKPPHESVETEQTVYAEFRGM